MLEDIGLHLTERQYDELVHILEYDGETIDSFKDLCFSIVESRTGKIECWFMNILGKWSSPKEVYDSITINHRYIPLEEFKDFLNEEFFEWDFAWFDENTTVDDVKEALEFELQECFDVTGGVVKTSYC